MPPTITPAPTRQQPSATPVSEGGATQPEAETPTEPASAGETTPAIDAQPEDVPILDGAYKLEISKDGTNIAYTVDGDIEVHMKSLAEKLEAAGWVATRNPDSATASMGTMLRQKENGDRVTISLQYNAKANFVIIRMTVLRAP